MLDETHYIGIARYCCKFNNCNYRQSLLEMPHDHDNQNCNHDTTVVCDGMPAFQDVPEVSDLVDNCLTAMLTYLTIVHICCLQYTYMNMYGTEHAQVLKMIVGHAPR